MLCSSQIATVLATFLPLWESRTMLVTILVKAITCNKADPAEMHKFGSFMGKPAVPRVQVQLAFLGCCLVACAGMQWSPATGVPLRHACLHILSLPGCHTRNLPKVVIWISALHSSCHRLFCC